MIYRADEQVEQMLSQLALHGMCVKIITYEDSFDVQTPLWFWQANMEPVAPYSS